MVVLRDHATGKSKGFGFVIFVSEEAARACLKDGKVHLNVFLNMVVNDV